RVNGPFAVINAAAITPERMEIELFGVDQSNGSEGRKPGALEEAHGGTLFIDDIADLPRETQNKILRVLVDQTFQRVGGSTKIAVDVRIVSSTSRNLEALITEGKFREDLYHRLAVVPIRIPPLAERREDIPDLVDYFMDQISQATGLPKRRIGEDAMAVLQSHNWPGNVRQLRNNIERLMILAGGDPEAVMNASMLPPDVGSMVPSMPNGNGGEHLMGLPRGEARAPPGCGFDAAGHAERQWGRALDGPAAARCARGVRARISDRADQPLRWQHIADRRICRNGAVSFAPQAQGARNRLTAYVANCLRQWPLLAEERSRGSGRGPWLSVCRRSL